ncbi:uncharacterized protein LOC105168516 isoform X2 [Sesamum indicum]|uniref:Uncharacterized protein LOC105168516 isoform X2 n=1 Tax=Sesamum indicum TaxID=4182 RepID=A0A6I9TM07_SESIN|nr:uncharacterized protein LOC105168516 isoform X2 [Sesamum indicum]
MAQLFYSACACLQLPPRHPGTPSSSLYSSQLGSAIPRRIGNKLAVVTRPEVETDGCGTGTRVFVVSDLHTDYSENMCWVKSLSSRTHDKDVLVVAGDVAETYTNFLLTMSILKDKFRHVFFVPGNHDLWLRREKTDYACKDFHVCKWPDDLKNGGTSLALYFDSLNDENWYIVEDILRRCSHIISFSHFVPRQELCPEKRMLFYPNLPKIIGSKYLETRIRAIHGAEGRQSACHVFGHTHFCWDAILNGIRYVQAPLAYPRERKRRMNGGEYWLPFCIYSSGNFAERVSPCYWSDYYSVNPRTPEVTQLAPWVSRFYTKV